MIIRIKAGLGNQMFQYAFSRLLQLQYEVDQAELDFSYYDNYTGKMTMIGDLNTIFQSATKKDIREVCFFPHSQAPHSFTYRLGVFAEKSLNKKYFFEPNRSYINPTDLLRYDYLDGYWQSWRYVVPIIDTLKIELAIDEPQKPEYEELRNQIEKTNSVFLGVRRGDFLKEASHYYECTAAYYNSAIQYIEKEIENPVFYIFTNDPKWVGENLFTNHKMVFISREYNLSDIEENMLMRQTKAAIIPNSTFHWWGAMLNKHESPLVVRPKLWFLDESPIDIYPPDWIEI